MSQASRDLRSFIAELKENHAREYLCIADSLSGDWELAALTAALESKMRVPLIEYSNVQNSDFSVVHNVCSSLPRIARVAGCTPAELDERLSAAYDNLIKPRVIDVAAVHEVMYQGERVDLGLLPDIRYSEHETHPYLSAACVVACDVASGSSNLSFHRLMKHDAQHLGIYMTPDGHLDQIVQANKLRGKTTPIAVFIGAHPLWSLGSLAAGALDLDEYSVIGGLLGEALDVVRGQHNKDLLIPANAEIALEGEILNDREVAEGPYGEAFGYTSSVELRPVVRINCLSHRKQAVFQDIVPSKMEHMTMTSTAIRVHLQRSLLSKYDFIERIHLPAPMMVYLALKPGTDENTRQHMLRNVLHEQRFVKHAVAFDSEVRLDNARETQRAIALHVQADRDVITEPGLAGNGLDPSERDGKTTKWAIDCTASTVTEGKTHVNRIPQHVLDSLNVDDVIRRAQKPKSPPSGK